MRKTVFVAHRERSANRVFQYLVGQNLADRVPGATLHGYDLDIFGVRDVQIEPADRGRILVVEAGHDVNLERLASALTGGLCDSITLRCWGMRLEYLPDPGRVRACLRLQQLAHEAPSLANDEVALHVRAEDVFAQKPHPDYPPAPLSFYRRAVDDLGRRPVLLGQLADDQYGRAIRAAFPDARSLPPSSAIEDFLTLAAAPAVICSVSSFAWLAAWISPHAQVIAMPVTGLFSPLQRPDVDLLPHKDSRFRFYPVHQAPWRGRSRQLRAFLQVQGQAKVYEACEVETLRANALRTAPLAEAKPTRPVAMPVGHSLRRLIWGDRVDRRGSGRLVGRR